MIDHTKLDAIKARVAAATAGPWTNTAMFAAGALGSSAAGEYLEEFGREPDFTRQIPDDLGRDRKVGYWRVPLDEPAGDVYSEATGRAVALGESAPFGADDDGALEPADATFVAHARTDVPWLLDQIARLEHALEAARAAPAPARRKKTTQQATE